MKKAVCLVLKLLSFVACGLIFYYLSQGLIANFNSKKEIVTTAEHKIGKEWEGPVIAICSKRGFRDKRMNMPTLDDYLKNTVNVTEEILFGYAYMKYENGTLVEVRSRGDNNGF